MTRALVTVALTLLFAVLATVAIYATLLAFLQDEVPVARGEARTIEVPADLPPARPLEPIRVVSAVPASGRLSPNLPLPNGTATVRVSGASAQGGIGVLDARSLALRGWRRLSGMELPAEIVFEGIPPGTHRVVFAAGRDRARFGYVSSTRLVDDTTATIDTTVHEVRLNLQWASGSAPPLALPVVRRADDPLWTWSPSVTSAAGESTVPTEVIEALRAGQTTLRLGAGSYTLELEGAVVTAEHRDRLTFEVPATKQITLGCRRP